MPKKSNKNEDILLKANKTLNIAIGRHFTCMTFLRVLACIDLFSKNVNNFHAEILESAIKSTPSGAKSKRIMNNCSKMGQVVGKLYIIKRFDHYDR